MRYLPAELGTQSPFLRLFGGGSRPPRAPTWSRAVVRGPPRGCPRPLLTGSPSERPSDDPGDVPARGPPTPPARWASCAAFTQDTMVVTYLPSSCQSLRSRPVGVSSSPPHMRLRLDPPATAIRGADAPPFLRRATVRGQFPQMPP